MTLAMLGFLLLQGDVEDLLADELHSEVVEYKQGDVTLEGFLVYPKDAKGKPTLRWNSTGYSPCLGCGFQPTSATSAPAGVMNRSPVPTE